jgi:hypothetical protein
LDSLPTKVLAAEYRTVLPDERVLAAELDQTRRVIEGRRRPRTIAKSAHPSASKGKKEVPR